MFLFAGSTKVCKNHFQRLDELAEELLCLDRELGGMTMGLDPTNSATPVEPDMAGK